MASVNAFAVFGWDDIRNAKPGELGGGTQDLFTAAAAVGAGTSRVVRVVLADVAGLLSWA